MKLNLNSKVKIKTMFNYNNKIIKTIIINVKKVQNSFYSIIIIKKIISYKILIKVIIIINLKIIIINRL
jgi:hypothetical protein